MGSIPGRGRLLRVHRDSFFCRMPVFARISTVRGSCARFRVFRLDPAAYEPNRRSLRSGAGVVQNSGCRETPDHVINNGEYSVPLRLDVRYLCKLRAFQPYFPHVVGGVFVAENS